MSNEQIEAKALELYPGTGTYADIVMHLERAAFIKGCQYAATPSAVSREEAEKWADENSSTFDGYATALAMYDHLAPLSPAQPGLIELSCMYCGEKFMGTEPERCCSGSECACMGMPIDPVVCSRGCHDMVMQGKGVIFDNRSAPPVAITPLPSSPLNLKP